MFPVTPPDPAAGDSKETGGLEPLVLETIGSGVARGSECNGVGAVVVGVGAEVVDPATTPVVGVRPMDVAGILVATLVVPKSKQSWIIPTSNRLPVAIDIQVDGGVSVPAISESSRCSRSRSPSASPFGK